MGRGVGIEWWVGEGGVGVKGRNLGRVVTMGRDVI